MSYIGIDLISFYTPSYSIDLEIITEQQNIDSNKIKFGIMQDKSIILPPNEDIITMACNATIQIFDKHQNLKNEIDYVIFATESGVDFSKSAGIICNKLLNLQNKCVNIEIKQACYASTAALFIAKNHVVLNPKSKVLILSSDIAFYGFNSPGEITQGCGAVAMIISKNPRIAIIENKSSVYTDNCNDFFRPNNLETPVVNGKYSVKNYLDFLDKTFTDFIEQTKYKYSDFYSFCFHLPFAKIAFKGHDVIKNFYKSQNCDILSEDENNNKISKAIIYTKTIGNIYNSSLYLSLISLLENTNDNLSNQRIGMFSYGSGAIGQFFSLIIQKDYEKFLFKTEHQMMLSNLLSLDYPTYTSYWNEFLLREKSEFWKLDLTKNYLYSKYQIIEINSYIREYYDKNLY